MLNSEQLNARNFWVDVYHSALGKTITCPGGFFKSNEVACHSDIRAPLIGEHNEEILHDMLNISYSKIKELKKKNII